MTVKEPASEQVLGTDGGRPAPWAQARERLAASRAYWTATNHPSGRPHVRPVLAVWVDDALYVSSRRSATPRRTPMRSGGRARRTMVRPTPAPHHGGHP